MCRKKQDGCGFFNYEKFNENISQDKGLDVNERWHCHCDGVYTGKEFFEMSIENRQLTVEIWRQFLKREFLQKTNIKFLEGILHEDNLFYFYVVMEARRVCHLNDVLYYYRQRADSIMAIKNEKRAQSVFVVLLNILTYWKTHSFSNKESLCVAEYFSQLYEAYKLYSSYGKRSNKLSVGDMADKTVYELLYLQNEKSC